MTEEIIVDGVNVAGCEFYEPKAQVMTCHEESITKRCNSINCYYKQLKRLQSENEELKYRCEVYHQCDEMIKNTYGQAHKEAMRLTKENKELKEYKTSKENSYQLLQKQWKDLFVQNRELKEENKALVEENEDMKKSFVSHSEFMNILENNPNINWEKTAKDNIYLINKYRKALEEIRELVKGYKTSDGIIRQTTTEYLIQNKINEVLK